MKIGRHQPEMLELDYNFGYVVCAFACTRSDAFHFASIQNPPQQSPFKCMRDIMPVHEFCHAYAVQVLCRQNHIIFCDDPMSSLVRSLVSADAGIDSRVLFSNPACQQGILDAFFEFSSLADEATMDMLTWDMKSLLRCTNPAAAAAAAAKETRKRRRADDDVDDDDVTEEEDDGGGEKEADGGGGTTRCSGSTQWCPSRRSRSTRTSPRWRTT